MMFPKLAMVFLAVLSVTSAQQQQALEKNAPADLLDAGLDAPFLEQPPRLLQGQTPAPSPAPEGAFATFAPSSMPTGAAPVTSTSGASSWRPSAGVASALVFVGSVAAAAMMA